MSVRCVIVIIDAKFQTNIPNLDYVSVFASLFSRLFLFAFAQSNGNGAVCVRACQRCTCRNIPTQSVYKFRRMRKILCMFVFCLCIWLELVCFVGSTVIRWTYSHFFVVCSISSLFLYVIGVRAFVCVNFCSLCFFLVLFSYFIRRYCDGCV